MANPTSKKKAAGARPPWRFVLLGGVLASLLYTTVPIALTLSGDEHSRVTLVGRFGYYVDPTSLTLDLWAARGATTVDLTRALFQVAASRKRWPPVRHVTLSRRNRPVFTLPGDEFRELAELLEAGGNPDDLMRSLPGRLNRPSGERAFGASDGASLDEQMEILNRFGQAWAMGTE